MKNKRRTKRPTKRTRRPRKPAHRQDETTAIVKIESPQALAPVRPQTFSIAPKIRQTVADMEQVRRFVSQCLNTDYRRKAPTIQAEIEKLENAIENREPTNKEKKQLRKLGNQITDLEIDYGTIPGSKPFLKQPGAEKFMLWLNLRPTYHRTITDLGDGHLEVVSYCTFHVKGTQEVVFEGPEASCTTMETNFRYIWAEAQREPTQDEVDQGYQTKMGKWQYITKWKKGQRIDNVKTWFVRIDNPNIWNERNKVRQQGQKRGLVKGVRNMGAISEIFQAGPDEWDLGPEDETDSQDVDRDYTEGGRRIYVDGKSPSGKHSDPRYNPPARRSKLSHEEIEKLKAEGCWCEKHQGDIFYCPSDEHTNEENEIACAKIEERKQRQKSPERQPAQGVGDAAARSPERIGPKGTSAVDSSSEPFLGKVTVDCNDPQGIAVRGDLSNLTEALEQYCAARFLNGWWRIPPERIDTLAAICKQGNYEFIIEGSPPVPPGTAERKRSTKTGSGNSGSAPAASKARKSAPKATPGEHVVEGIIEKALTKQGAKPRIDFLVKTDRGSFWMACWSKTWFTRLAEEPLPKPVTLIIKTKVKDEKTTFRDIIRATKIGKKEYDEEGKEVLQQSQREAGGKTLFG